MWRARGISSFCHSGVGWGSPNFNSVSSMLSFLSELLCALRVEPAANVSASGPLSLGGVLSPKGRTCAVQRAVRRGFGGVAWWEPLRSLPGLGGDVCESLGRCAHGALAVGRKVCVEREC